MTPAMPYSWEREHLARLVADDEAGKMLALPGVSSQGNA
jgi:hypothetical protein